MNYGKNMLIMVVALTLVMVLAIGVGPVFAVDDLDLFELDNNGTTVPGEANAREEGTAGDDWQTLHAGGGGSLYFTGVKADPPPLSIFTGGRKDIQDIPDWGWKEGSVPDKDDLTNAYAAAYVCPEATSGCTKGDLIIYFGADRYANNGDAFMGFWFFQDTVEAINGGDFKGEHKDGDILVLVNFPQCKKEGDPKCMPEINVVVWDPEHDYPGNIGAAATNLSLLYQGQVCDGGGGWACANTNDGDEFSPWSYTPKDNSSDTFPYESFFEGGINITKLLGKTPCFGSFMAETRSSKSFTATLKDFVLEPFELCKIEVEKVCEVAEVADPDDPNNPNKRYFKVHVENTVTNTGVGTLPAGAQVCVDDTPANTELSDDPDEECITLGTDLGVGDSVKIPSDGLDFFSDQNPPTNNVKAWAEFDGNIVEAEQTNVECTYLELNPALSLSKDCYTELEIVDSLVAVKVNFSGEVCNTGDVPLTVTVKDNDNIVFGPQVLKAKEDEEEDCGTITGSYNPESANSNDPCLASFTDTFTATGTSPIPGVDDVTEIRTATCPLCDCCDQCCEECCVICPPCE